MTQRLQLLLVDLRAPRSPPRKGEAPPSRTRRCAPLTLYSLQDLCLHLRRRRHSSISSSTLWGRARRWCPLLCSGPSPARTAQAPCPLRAGLRPCATWAYVLWSLVPGAMAMLFGFNAGRSRSTWQGFSLRWYYQDPDLSVAARRAGAEPQARGADHAGRHVSRGRARHRPGALERVGLTPGQLAALQAACQPGIAHVQAEMLKCSSCLRLESLKHGAIGVRGVVLSGLYRSGLGVCV